MHRLNAIRRRFSAAAAAATSPAVPSMTAGSLESAALKPSQVVLKLDDYIVGQPDAKKAVAIALRNRWRRHMLPEHFKSEVRI